MRITQSNSTTAILAPLSFSTRIIRCWKGYGKHKRHIEMTEEEEEEEEEENDHRQIVWGKSAKSLALIHFRKIRYIP